jgi:hypothetical protein
MLTPRAKAWRGSGESIEVGGRRIFIRDRTGAGPPLPLLRPCAPVTRLPQLGHYPQLEDPSAVAEILRRF